MRESKFVTFLHAAGATGLLLAPAMVLDLAPEFTARFLAWLDTMPYLVTGLLCFAWLLAIIGCMWPPYQVVGRWFWGLGAAGLIALVSWACATDVINDDFIIPALGEMGTTVVSAICGLLLCICVAGLIFDGPRRSNRSNAGGERVT